MKNTLTILVLLLGSNLFSQNGRVTLENLHKNTNKTHMIKLNIKHSKRIAFNDVSISINGLNEKEIKIKVVTKPLREDNKWNYSKIDTTFTVEKERFNEISKTVKDINPLVVQNNFKLLMNDGYRSSLEFGGFNNSIRYNVTSPTSDISNRYHIPCYREACLLILEVAGLKEFNIMGN